MRKIGHSDGRPIGKPDTPPPPPDPQPEPPARDLTRPFPDAGLELLRRQILAVETRAEAAGINADTALANCDALQTAFADLLHRVAALEAKPDVPTPDVPTPAPPAPPLPEPRPSQPE